MTNTVKGTTRKSLGAWYTPASIARPLVKWAIRSRNDHILDPAVGDGVFLIEAAQVLREAGSVTVETQLHGVDVNPDAVSKAREALARALGIVGVPHVYTRDFFQVEPPTGLFADLGYMDAIVGNPPYIRYQSFKGLTRATAMLRAERVGIRLTNLSSSWAPFVIHAVNFLRSSGRLALVLPEEMLHAAYASEVRKFLRATFAVTTVVKFDGHSFPDAEERVILVLADGKDEARVGELRLVTVRSPDQIGDLQDWIQRCEVFSPHDEPAKWEMQFDDPAALILERLKSSESLVPLRSIGKASIGYVTGANKYFVFTPSEAKRRKFPARILKPTILSARHAPGAVLTRGDLRRLNRLDERCLLWTGAGTSLRHVRAYVERGEGEGLSARYKCRVRDPWYVVPGIVEPDAFLTYMSDEIPRLILNQARATCSNNLLTVSLDDVDRRFRPMFVAAFYNSATMLSAERTGRRYGGGVLKLEPSEADRVLVPSPKTLERLERTGLQLNQVDVLLRSRNTAALLSEVDDLVLRRALGLDINEFEAIRSSLLRRKQTRKPRLLDSLGATPS